MAVMVSSSRAAGRGCRRISGSLNRHQIFTRLE